MEIRQPLCITSRLLPGVKIGEATISIEYAHVTSDGRQVYRWFIDNAFREENFHSYDLVSGVGGGSLQEGLESLLGFLGAFAEAIDYQEMSGREADCTGMFPAELAGWATANSNEISMLELNLQENPGKYILEQTIISDRGEENMAHFYGTVQGAHGEVTRTGDKKSGMVTYCASHHGAVRCHAYVNSDGIDYVRIERLAWRGAGPYVFLYDGPFDSLCLSERT